ncbi:MAG: hypothetical protein NUW01_05995 [Gemmatimonadaceae bacterium]|nr:hypothetical protein [Gemmatimonadaceae bacterium]
MVTVFAIVGAVALILAVARWSEGWSGGAQRVAFSTATLTMTLVFAAALGAIVYITLTGSWAQ